MPLTNVSLDKKPKPVIQDMAVVATFSEEKESTIGEASRFYASNPLPKSERLEMLHRLKESISELMEDAHAAYKAHAYKEDQDVPYWKIQKFLMP